MIIGLYRLQGPTDLYYLHRDLLNPSKKGTLYL